MLRTQKTDVAANTTSLSTNPFLIDAKASQKTCSAVESVDCYSYCIHGRTHRDTGTVLKRTWRVFVFDYSYNLFVRVLIHRQTDQ